MTHCRRSGCLAHVATALLVIVAAGHRSEGQSPLSLPPVALDSLLRSPGPAWQRARSRHFVLYTERRKHRALAPTVLLDSLEDAWRHAAALLGGDPPDREPVTVLVTGSAERFPTLLTPSNRGLTRQDEHGRDVIVLVHNDSVRAFTRHEVMHVVSFRMLGPRAAPWVLEGVATWADGRCQSTSVLAVARDLLRDEPFLDAAELPARVKRSLGADLGERMRAYVLAASLVGFVYHGGGPQALRALWRSGVVPGAASPLTDTVTAAWRRYVRQRASGEPGLPAGALDRRGCG